MEKRLNWKDNLVKAAGIPEDLAYGQPVVTVTGHKRAVIQNYRGILLYTSEKLVLRTSHGKVTVCGKDLQILSYCGDEMEITGWIGDIHLG
ncbi:MAG: YabP/YqfC family sporulation protein [Blautia glucerasea]|nr:YabP/YqfC family sporulation protein [Blautia glucerasea]MDY3085319.1 YabP/YqfC family sporulation protein [Blautia sp.]